ncbi:MAG TPA: ankyrin repeat domain-containing protein [Noviherbaspirillum sp.]|nr:ankyrin repeat domain-containing protein [Noviherbaspirillum sp.]
MTELVFSIRRRLSLVALAVVTATLWIPHFAFAGAYEEYFRAVVEDKASTVQSLLDQGFDPNTIEPERGDSGLILALREGSMGVFDILLNAKDIDLELKSRNGDNALMIACYKGNQQAVEALLAKGAQVNRPGWTPAALRSCFRPQPDRSNVVESLRIH